MRLKKVVISGFRSFKQAETLRVEDRVTVLIGANDHGKTNVLAAIELLNDDKVFSDDDENWDATGDTRVAIEWHFEAGDNELRLLDELSTPSEGGAKDAALEVDETEDNQDGPDAIFSNPTAPASFPVNTENSIVYVRDLPADQVRVLSLPQGAPSSAEKKILELRPRIELFSPPSPNIKDQVSLSGLETAEFEFMQGIFRLAGIWDDRASIFVQNDRTSKILDEASERLTRILNDKWNQGRDLRWKLEHTGTNGDHIVIMIKDPAISDRYTRPSLRSSGFKTYFLLSMIIFARTENRKQHGHIYLFDEPGTYLHPHAQLDLQRSFEAISARTQLVYTTHSLFLVNKNHPGRNRVVSKGKDGSKFDQKPFTRNWKAVRESLGVMMSNNFLIAEKTLLVEGPSDVIYVLDAIRKLKASGAVDVDLNDLSIVDAGVSDNYVAMAKLMVSEGRSVVALLDGDKAGDQIATQLKKACPQEVRQRRLQIHALPRDQSSEDAFCDVKVLRSAVKDVAEDLIKLGVRKFKGTVDLLREVEQLASQDGVTLGRVINNTTEKWFDPADRISKLSIALRYEDLAPGISAVPEEAEEQIKTISKLLGLKGEANQEQGVFEEDA